MGFRMKIFMKQLNNNNIFFSLATHFESSYPLQVEDCDSNTRFVVDEDDNGKLSLERVKPHHNYWEWNVCSNIKINKCLLSN